MRVIPKNWPADLPVPPPTPRHYYEGHQWISEHIRELKERYPDQWVAVFHGEVIAAGKDASEVQRAAKEQTGERDIAIWLVEATRRFYPGGHDFSSSDYQSPLTS